MFGMAPRKRLTREITALQLVLNNLARELDDLRDLAPDTHQAYVEIGSLIFAAEQRRLKRAQRKTIERVA
jgi:hypothetical protein